MHQTMESRAMPGDFARNPQFQETSSGWSILEGRFDPDLRFPAPEKLEEFESLLEDKSKEESESRQAKLQKRIYYSSLMLYAIEACNPALFSDKNRVRSVGGEVREAIGKCLDLEKSQRQERLKRLTTDNVYPKEVPVMQALKELQEHGVIDYEERTLFDAAVRMIYLKQTTGNFPSLYNGI